MHQRNVVLDSHIAVAQEDSDRFIDLEQLLTMARRRLGIVALFAAIGLGLGIAYLAFTPSSYTAATRILLDDSLNRLAEEQDGVPAQMQVDSMVLSEVEILRSSQLARSVAEALDLHENEAFLNPPRSPLSWLKATIKDGLALVLPAEPEAGGASSPASRLGRAAALLQMNLVAERVGRSFVLEVKYTANDRELAGSVTRTYADQYLSDQLNANFDATQRAMVWLQDRLTGLRDDWLAASLAVEQFRAEHGLTAARGELVSEQQLSDLNNQLVLAQAETANARARYEQYSAIVESGSENAVANAVIPTDVANSEVLNELKTRYLDAAEREADVSEQFGADHPQAVTLRQQKDELTQQIFDELQQVARSYRNEYEVAQAREQSLRENVGALSGQSSEAGRDMVQLRELQQRADALGKLYETFLARYEEASQRQSFPIAEARVISQASDPVQPSAPRTTMVLALSLVLGLFAGAAAGALQEFRERFFRTGEDVRSALGMDFLGYLPVVGARMSTTKPERHAARDLDGQGLLRIAVNAPGSLFAETLRSTKLAGDVVLQGKPSKVFGFVSVLPREGKTTVASNFAGLLAANGLRTLLIDADLRNPGLSRRLSVQPERGIVEVLVGEEAWQNAVLVDQKTQLAIIPATVRSRLSHTSELISGPGMQTLLAEARQHYDYVIVDLPPLGPVVDARAFARLADAFVFVAEWGATPRALVRARLQAEPQIAAKTLGVILNKTDIRRLARYAPLGGSERYIDRYASYYGEGRDA